ncbi:hypothetical protein [Evansella tamaricis]|uniref:DUF4367 domain-containing protein n=1 Tax=Evansella tamaricis TaxID=2069301 RepID=A0ABS6JCL3_9BACI|nr:hypothetical protein [Evansella tamaricis]MBU9710587.1 hypothetical protein [Evansella tamaricis]
MKQFDDHDSFEQGFEGIKKKVIPTEKEKYDIFHQLNTEMEKRANLDQAEMSGMSAESHTEKTPVRYYVSLGVAAAIIFLLFLPTWLPGFGDDGTADDNNPSVPTQEEDRDDTEPADEEIEGTEPVEEEESSPETMEENLFLDDVTDMDAVSHVILSYSGAGTNDINHYHVHLENPALSDVLQETKQLRVEKAADMEIYQYYNRENYQLQVFHDSYGNTTTEFYFFDNKEIYIRVLRDFQEVDYRVTTDNTHNYFKRVWSIKLEEEERKSAFDGDVAASCGYVDTTSTTYRFGFNLAEGQPSHPILCINPVLEGESEIFAGSTFTGLRERSGFYYHESSADNIEQGLTIMVEENDMPLHSGTREDVLKKTDSYSIYKEDTGAVYDDGYRDIVYVADGVLNDKYHFHIIFFDREDRYTEKEIISIIENQLIHDIMNSRN